MADRPNIGPSAPAELLAAARQQFLDIGAVATSLAGPLLTQQADALHPYRVRLQLADEDARAGQSGADVLGRGPGRCSAEAMP